MLYPISLQRIGRDEGVFTFYVESAAMRTEWATNLPKAIEAHAARQKATQVIALDVLSDQTFGAAETYGSLVPPAPVESQFGNPTCSAPLTTADGQNLVVAGCAQGLFIGFRGKPRTMKQVVHLAGITQCAILAEFGFILVVAQKVLIACAFAPLPPGFFLVLEPQAHSFRFIFSRLTRSARTVWNSVGFGVQDSATAQRQPGRPVHASRQGRRRRSSNTRDMYDRPSLTFVGSRF